MSFEPASLFASVVISAIGFGLFLYGKRAQRLPHLLTGLALMVFPYFVESVVWMIAIAAALLHRDVVGRQFAVDRTTLTAPTLS